MSVDLFRTKVEITEEGKISGLPIELLILYFGKTKDNIYIIHCQENGTEYILLGIKTEMKNMRFRKIPQNATAIYLTPYQFVVFRGRPELNLYRGHILTQLPPVRA